MQKNMLYNSFPMCGGKWKPRGGQSTFSFPNQEPLQLKKKQIKRKTLGKYSVIYWSKVLLI